MSLDDQIDKLCDQFEAAWNEGKRPKISRILSRTPTKYHAAILKHLIPVDVECRGKNGQSPRPEEYADFGHAAFEIAVNTMERLESPATTVIPNKAVKQSRLIGQYKILQEIGEGGMGIVFMAEQSHPVRRRVALKLIKAGMDSKDVITRFEAERQALAMMDHPNIAKVLDAGTTNDGRPYFVMELVQGISITEYCDKNKLTIGDRLRLFAETCRAIQHAHQKSIIHRDIKPSNVLVHQSDGVPSVRVIDFGLAKALQMANRLTDKTMFTQFGQILGTFQYMSPEQAETNVLDIDTRSDVYSLGVVLFELLTGDTPLKNSSLNEMSLDQKLLAIREQEAPRPSARLNSLGGHAAPVCEQRKTDTRKLTVTFKGELDWITMKALAKDRSRRYESAGSLATDIEHHISGDIVSARAPSLLYLTSRIVKRYRAIVSSVAMILIALCVGLVLSIHGMLKYRDGERAERASRIQIAESKSELTRQLYYANIEQAGQRLREGNVRDAQRLLDLTPEELRGWEHKYLTQLSDQSDLAINAHPGGVQYAEVNHDSTQVVTTSEDGHMSVWNTHDGACLASSDSRHEAKIRIPFPESGYFKAQFDAKNQRLVVALQNGDVVLMAVERFNQVARITAASLGPPAAFALCRHGDGFVILAGNEVSVWNIEARLEDEAELKHRLSLLSSNARIVAEPTLGVHPDGIHTVALRQRLQVINLETAEISMFADRESLAISSARNISFDKDGRQFAVSSNGRVVRIPYEWTAKSRLATSGEFQPFEATSCAFAPNSNTIICGLNNGQLAFCRSDGLHLPSELTLNGHADSIRSIKFSPSGDLICTAGRDGAVRLWQLKGPNLSGCNRRSAFQHASVCGV